MGTRVDIETALLKLDSEYERKSWPAARSCKTLDNTLKTFPTLWFEWGRNWLVKDERTKFLQMVFKNVAWRRTAIERRVEGIRQDIAELGKKGSSWCGLFCAPTYDASVEKSVELKLLREENAVLQEKLGETDTLLDGITECQDVWQDLDRVRSKIVQYKREKQNRNFYYYESSDEETD